MKCGFTSICIEDYIKSHMENNPNENRKALKENLLEALKDYKNGQKCHCGNDIWVIGSAIVGNACFTCITGEANSDEDYEIEGAC